MEFDILNDIMQSVVGTLFSPISMLKMEINKSPNQTSNLSGETDKYIAELPEKSIKSYSLDDSQKWVNAEGKVWLENAMNRLGLDASKISGKEILKFTYQELISEKKKIKSELKLYDTNFVKLFNKQPQRIDKEHIRQLYVYYKFIKIGIKKKENEKKKEEKKSFKPFNVEISKKIQELKSERSILRNELDKFQQEFIQVNNRKIKYAKDIEPVAFKFKRYKELKQIILDLENGEIK